MALATSAVLATSGEFWGPLGGPQWWMHTLRSVHDRSCSLGANENSCDRAVGERCHDEDIMANVFDGGFTMPSLCLQETLLQCDR